MDLHPLQNQNSRPFRDHPYATENEGKLGDRGAAAEEARVQAEAEQLPAQVEASGEQAGAFESQERGGQQVGVIAEHAFRDCVGEGWVSSAI